MLKNSKKLGKSSSKKVEVSDITERGIWLLVAGKEYFLPYSEYPWFLNAKIKEIFNIEFSHEHYLYWPDLDIDLSTDIFENPEKYPLTARMS